MLGTVQKFSHDHSLLRSKSSREIVSTFGLPFQIQTILFRTGTAWVLFRNCAMPSTPQCHLEIGVFVYKKIVSRNFYKYLRKIVLPLRNSIHWEFFLSLSLQPWWNWVIFQDIFKIIFAKNICSEKNFYEEKKTSGNLFLRKFLDI